MGNIKNTLPKSNSHYNQGFFRPYRPEKYLGDVNRIIFRSSWELKFMQFCDSTEKVLKWNSEGLKIPYFNPLSKTMNNYYIDFFVILKNHKNELERWLMEVKPSKFTEPPVRPVRMTPKVLESYMYAAKQYIINRAKFEAARDFVVNHDMQFGIITEQFLFKGL